MKAQRRFWERRTGSWVSRVQDKGRFGRAGKFVGWLIFAVERVGGMGMAFTVSHSHYHSFRWIYVKSSIASRVSPPVYEHEIYKGIAYEARDEVRCSALCLSSPHYVQRRLI